MHEDLGGFAAEFDARSGAAGGNRLAEKGRSEGVMRRGHVNVLVMATLIGAAGGGGEWHAHMLPVFTGGGPEAEVLAGAVK